MSRPPKILESQRDVNAYLYRKLGAQTASRVYNIMKASQAGLFKNGYEQGWYDAMKTIKASTPGADDIIKTLGKNRHAFSGLSLDDIMTRLGNPEGLSKRALSQYMDQLGYKSKQRRTARGVVRVRVHPDHDAVRK